MQDFIYHLTIWHWISFSVLLTILEVTIGASFFLLWTGVCSILVAVCLALYPSLPWEYQLIIFALSTIASIFFWHINLKNNLASSDEPRLNRRSEQYIGRIFTLNEPIVNGRGKIQVDDSFWRVEGDDLPAGTKIKVISANGVVLKVKSV
jgi:inner membrane protein